MTRIDDIKTALHDRIVAILQKFQDASAAAGAPGDLSDAADQIVADMREHASDLLDYLQGFVPGGGNSTPPELPPVEPEPPVDAPPVEEPPIPEPIPPAEVPATPPELVGAEADLHDRLTQILGELDATAAELNAMADRIIADMKIHAPELIVWLQDQVPHVEPRGRRNK
jgi:hypothetical protein